MVKRASSAVERGARFESQPPETSTTPRPGRRARSVRRAHPAGAAADFPAASNRRDARSRSRNGLEIDPARQPIRCRVLPAADPGAASEKASRKPPSSVSSTLAGPVKPIAASSAAMTPAWAARPGCRRLLIAPSALKANRPDPCVAPRPSAQAVASSSSLKSTAPAAAAPSGPHTPVRCQPRSRAAFGSSAREARTITS